ncbi:MAG: lysophospholipid acyltransferase family protein [Bernardetiaceae bacterium]|nr:lysophospholipid acyltransferase family protein [Bernardetiaceae bacterium]
MPWPITYGLSNCLFILLNYLLRYRRQVVVDNLRRAFPHKSERELTRLRRGFYRHLADVAMETLKTLALPQAELEKRLTIVGRELMTNALQAQRPVIVMATHGGNWEWASLGAQLVGRPHVMLPVYKKLASPLFEKLMLELRSRMGARPVPKEQTLREVVRCRKNNELFALGLMADQSPAGWELDLWLDLFGHPTPFYSGADKLARQCQATVLFAEMFRTKRGHYQLIFSEIKSPPFSADPQEIIAIYRDKLQASIEAHPEQWLWSHKRWKHAPPVA